MIFNTFINKKDSDSNFGDYYFAHYYFNTISNIDCVNYILKPENYEDLLELFSNFKNVNTVEMSKNNIILSDMLPFFISLFEDHPTIKNFIFCRNRLLPENPLENDYKNLEACLELMKKCNLKLLNLSGNLEENNQSDILDILTRVFKNSELESLLLDSTNIIEENNFFKVLEEFGGENSSIRHLYFENNNIVLSNMCEFYCKLFDLLNATLSAPTVIPQRRLTCIPFNLSSLNFGNPDNYVEDENEYDTEYDNGYNYRICDELFWAIHRTFQDNVALTEFTSMDPSVDAFVKPYLERNLKMFWIWQNTHAFSNDFFKVLITFLLANKSFGDNKQPQLPIHICFKIFGFFQNKMFL